MSHAIGEVICLQTFKTIAYFLFNDSSHVAVSCLHNADEWGVQCEWRICVCKHPPIDVLLVYDQKYPTFAPGQVCLNCKAIVQQHTNWISCGDTMCDRYGCKHWPGVGRPTKESYDELIKEIKFNFALDARNKGQPNYLFVHPSVVIDAQEILKLAKYDTSGISVDEYKKVMKNRLDKYGI